MEDTQALADRYAAAWNEQDEAARRAAIERMWSPLGAHFVKTLEARGYDALEQRVTGAHLKNVRDLGNRFRARKDARRLRDVVTFTWEMVPAAGNEVLAVGLEFVRLDPDDRILEDYQFIVG